MKSWKTTVAGVLAILISVLGVVSTIVTDGVNAVEWGVVVPAILAGVGALFARDNDKTSEDVGASE